VKAENEKAKEMNEGKLGLSYVFRSCKFFAGKKS